MLYAVYKPVGSLASLVPAWAAMATKKKRSTSRRDTVKSKSATFYAKRTTMGRFKRLDEKSRSLKADRRRRAKKTTRSGYGDQGDRRRRKAA